MMYRITLLLLLSLGIEAASMAQMLDPVKWEFSKQKVTEGKYLLKATAELDSGWHIYSKDIAEGGPIPLSWTFKENKQFQLVGTFQEKGNAKEKYDPNFDMKLKLYSNQVTLLQRIKLTGSKGQVESSLEFMTCDAKRCLPPKKLSHTFQLGEASSNEPSSKKEKEKENTSSPPSSEKETTPPEDKEKPPATSSPPSQTAQDTTVSTDTAISSPNQVNLEKGEWPCDKKKIKQKEEESSSDKSLWTIFLAGLAGGFIAIVTPCVFPMIPLTVSFFTKDNDQEDSSNTGVRNAIIFGLSIIILYVGLGTLLTLLFGADIMNKLSSNVGINLFLFALFVFFALSFFGAFELRVPSSWTTKSEQLTEKGGMVGIFFMAFTLALVSFSCTAPIIGTLLVITAVEGSMLSPIIGMAGFSIALALPFTALAVFPSWLKSMQSGGWMNTVKVVMGFLELMLALKFLSVADLVGGWGFLKREIFISLWIIILALMGFYLLGKLRFPLDSKVEKISIKRLFFAILSFAFALYLVPGIWGAPVKLISGIAPPSTYKEWKQPGEKNVRGNCPHNIPCFYKFEKGLAYAKKVNKPILLDFTGYSCENCRRMEDNVWSQPEILEMLKNDYVLVSLYVDKRKELPKSEQYTSEATGQKITTVGEKWVDFQVTCYNHNAQPYYVPIHHNGQKLAPPKGYVNAETYRQFLEKGLEKFKKINGNKMRAAR